MEREYQGRERIKEREREKMGGLIHVDIEWSGGRRKSGKERKNEMGGSELGGVRENKREKEEGNREGGNR